MTARIFIKGFLTNGWVRRPGSMPASRNRLPVEDFRIWIALHYQISCQPALKPRKSMIHEDVSSRHLELEFDHGCAAGRDKCGLHIGQRIGSQRCLVIDSVKDLANDMEG